MAGISKRGIHAKAVATALGLTLGALWPVAAGAEELAATAAVASPPPPSPWSKLKVSGAWRTRAEMWDFFEPSGTAGANNTYSFVGSDLRLNATWTDDWFDVFVEGQGVVLGELPDNAVGGPTEGPLGLGAVYRSNNNGDEDDVSVYIRQAALKWKKLGVKGLWIKGGRQVFAEGKEAVPADATLAWVQNFRVAERLIGPFDFTYAGRSFDSVQSSYTNGAFNLTAFYGKPTQGGFAIDGMEEIDDIDVVYNAVNLNQPSFSKNTAARLFHIYYGDDRFDGAFKIVKLDNRPLAARQADLGDIAIHTIGADLLQLVPTGIGNVDLMGWFAYQAGDWGALDQSSWAFALEAGLQPDLPWKPWLRAGFNMSSGDDEAADGDHETFFQILPTPRQYSLSTFYNLMNNEDAFAQFILRPRPGLMWRTDLHVLRLSEDDDLWYFGGGATRNTSQAGLGYGSRPSGGKQSLMEVLETQLSYTWNDYVTTTVYYGHGFGEDVVDADFSGKDANYGYFEVTLKLPPTGPK